MKQRNARILSASFIAAACAFFTSSAPAQLSAGGGVRNLATIDLGGAALVSGDNRFAVTAFVSGPGGVGVSGDNRIVARQGPMGFVFELTSLTAASAEPSIGEAGSPPPAVTSAALSGQATFDDGTSGVLPGSLLAWDNPPLDGPLSEITLDGEALASTVYQDSPVAFAGGAGGLRATNYLTVLNILPDNYREWADDTFDDAWEISQGMPGAVDPQALNAGIPYWQLYAMGRNPLLPVAQPLAVTQVEAGYLAITYTRNTAASGYTFTPQEAGPLAVGFTNIPSPVSTTNVLSPELEQVTTRASQPMSSTNQQFLRVRIALP